MLETGTAVSEAENVYFVVILAPGIGHIRTWNFSLVCSFVYT